MLKGLIDMAAHSDIKYGIKVTGPRTIVSVGDLAFQIVLSYARQRKVIGLDEFKMIMLSGQHDRYRSKAPVKNDPVVLETLYAKACEKVASKKNIR